MESLTQFALNKAYEMVEKLSDHDGAYKMIDWEKFWSIGADMYDNRSKKCSRPNFYNIFMFNLLILDVRQLLSYPELERHLET